MTYDAESYHEPSRELMMRLSRRTLFVNARECERSEKHGVRFEDAPFRKG